MAGTIYLAAALAFVICLAAYPFYIRFSKRLRFGQQIRLDGPQKHLEKAGTPTMGGIVFLVAFLITSVIFLPRDPLSWAALIVIFAVALLGFADDFQKVVKHRSLGLRARHKILGHLVFSFIFYLVLLHFGHATAVMIPFSAMQVEIGHFYLLLIFFMVTGASNSVNLTDGIDGLAAGTAILSLLAFLIIASLQGQHGAAYLCASLIGACTGFLIYNIHPARVFMGDVGSLSLGAALALVAVLLKTELLLVVIGGVFVLEAISVILQVAFFRLTGKRIFLMSPLHHHFEIKGWSEWSVVTGFWMTGLCFALLGLLGYAFAA